MNSPSARISTYPHQSVFDRFTNLDLSDAEKIESREPFNPRKFFTVESATPQGIRSEKEDMSEIGENPSFKSLAANGIDIILRAEAKLFKKQKKQEVAHKAYHVVESASTSKRGVGQKGNQLSDAIKTANEAEAQLAEAKSALFSTIDTMNAEQLQRATEDFDAKAKHNTLLITDRQWLNTILGDVSLYIEKSKNYWAKAKAWGEKCVIAHVRGYAGEQFETFVSSHRAAMESALKEQQAARATRDANAKSLNATLSRVLHTLELQQAMNEKLDQVTLETWDDLSPALAATLSKKLSLEAEKARLSRQLNQPATQSRRITDQNKEHEKIQSTLGQLNKQIEQVDQELQNREFKGEPLANALNAKLNSLRARLSAFQKDFVLRILQIQKAFNLEIFNKSKKRLFVAKHLETANKEGYAWLLDTDRFDTSTLHAQMSLSLFEKAFEKRAADYDKLIEQHIAEEQRLQDAIKTIQQLERACC